MNFVAQHTEPEVFDIAVIGGGIAGAAIARDAALRGFTVALLEKNRCGSGTSSKSSRLIHGGVRYLETAWNRLREGSLPEAFRNFRFVFASLREAATLERLAPDLIRRIPLLIPVYSGDKRRPLTVYAGTGLYGMLAALSGDLRRPRILRSPEAVLRELPDLDPKDLVGGVIIWERLTDDAGLVRAITASAARHGTRVFERTEVTAYSRRPDGSYVLQISQESRPRELLAKKIVNAAGPWADTVRSRGNESGADMIAPVAGAHIMLKRFLPISALLQAEDDRFFFAVNTGDSTRVGTTERAFGDPDRVEATKEDISYLLRGLRRYFPGRAFSESDVISADAGVRPLARPEHLLRESEISREHQVRTGGSGVIHVLGVKLTDHRRVAEEVVDRLVREAKGEGRNLRKSSLTDRVRLDQ